MGSGRLNKDSHYVFRCGPWGLWGYSPEGLGGLWLAAGLCPGLGGRSFKKNKMSTLLSDHYLENSCGNVQFVPKIMGTVSRICLISQSIPLSNSWKSSLWLGLQTRQNVYDVSMQMRGSQVLLDFSFFATQTQVTDHMEVNMRMRFVENATPLLHPGN